MNIAIIGSGGDGAGMNECLYTLCSKLKKHNVILFYHGLQGIIENEVVTFSLNQLKNERKKGGIIIKSSRSAEFMTEKGFNKCINNLKKNKVDILIVMGGNGSLQATQKIVSAGIACVFIPTTIDNDIKQSDYCIGYSTAKANAIDFIQKVNTSMQAFDRTCIYEVMGRHCPDIANSVTKAVNACFCFVSTSKKTDLLKAVKTELKTNTAPIIILQENTTPIDELKQYLLNNIKDIDVKTAIIGYVQRGGFATKEELKMARGFASLACKLINSGNNNFMVTYQNNTQSFVSENLI